MNVLCLYIVYIFYFLIILLKTHLVLSYLYVIYGIARFNEFDATGGPFSKELIPKLTVVRKNLSSKLGVAIPDFNATYVRLLFLLLYVMVFSEWTQFFLDCLSDWNVSYRFVNSLPLSYFSRELEEFCLCLAAHLDPFSW